MDRDLVKLLYADLPLLSQGRGKDKWFWGIDNRYTRLIDCLSCTDGHKLLVELCPAGQKPCTLEEVCKLSGDERLRQLARLRLGNSGYTANDLLSSLDYPSIEDLSAKDLAPDPMQLSWYKTSHEWLRQRCGSGLSEWSVAHWRALGFVSDLRNQTGQPLQETAIERTPILLANKSFGRVLWLVAERIPGPPIVTPHWWRLGLLSLGQAGEPHHLLHQIQATMRRVLQFQAFPWQVRWWLQTYSLGGDWHDSIEFDESPSIQAAAACAVMALAEERSSRPVLDKSAVVTAELDDADNLLDVGDLEKKIEACHKAHIQCLVMSPALVDRFKDYAKQHAPELQLVSATKLDDTYEILQSTSPTIQTAKSKYVSQWNSVFLETDTEKRFVDATKTNN